MHTFHELGEVINVDDAAVEVLALVEASLVRDQFSRESDVHSDQFQVRSGHAGVGAQEGRDLDRLVFLEGLSVELGEVFLVLELDGLSIEHEVASLLVELADRGLSRGFISVDESCREFWGIGGTMSNGPRI